MNEALAWLILLGCVKVKYLVLVFNSPAGCLKRQDILVGFLANHFVLCHAPLIICVCVCVTEPTGRRVWKNAAEGSEDWEVY